MIKYVLSVTCTESETSYKLDQLMIHTVYISFQNCSFALLFNSVLNLAFCLVNHFFNTCRMDSTVGYKLFKSDPCHFTSDMIKAGKRNCFRGIVNNKVDARKSFKGSDVSSLTSDNSSLHLVVRKGNYGYSSLRYLISGTFSDSKRNIASCFFFTFVFYLLFISGNFQSFFVHQITVKHIQNIFLSLISCKF